MASKKNVLLVSYYFPPLAMGGIGRPYALFRYLPDYGYDVTVLTVKNISYPQYDHTLLNENDEKSIIRTGSLDPSRIMRMIGIEKPGTGVSSSVKAALYNFPDTKRGWIRFALAGAKKIIRNKDIAAVITTSPPPSAHMIGMKLKERTKVKWIADFRDFWFSLPIELVNSTRFQKAYSLRLKEQIVNSANAVAVVNSSIKNYLGRGEVIMNGADPEVSRLWQNKNSRAAEGFTIGSLGTMNYLCPMEPLFKAVASLIRKDPAMADKIEIVHVGHYDKKMMHELIQRYGLHSIVTPKGYLPKAEAIQTLALADMLYLSVADFGAYHILPGRVFDYLLSGKPILGIVPGGSDAETLLDEYGNSRVVSADDIDAAVTYIREVYDAKPAGKIKKTVDAEIMSKYTTPNVAGRYAKLLDEVIG